MKISASCMGYIVFSEKMLKGQTQQSKEDVALTQKVGKRRISLCMILLSLTALLKGLLVVLAKMVSSAKDPGHLTMGH